MADSTRDSEKTLIHLIRERVAQDPDLPVLGYKEEGDWKDVRFRDHFDRVRKIALGLIELGLEEGDRGVIFSNTRKEWSESDWGFILAKGIAVPIYPSNREDEAAFLIDHSGSRIAIIESQEMWDRIYPSLEKGKLDRVVVMEGNFPQHEKAMSFNDLIQLGEQKESQNQEELNKRMDGVVPDDLFSITYTSGTTGVPKGVEITHRMMWQTLEDAHQYIGKNLGPGDLTLAFLPLSHILGRFESFMPYRFRAQTVFAESIDAIMANIQEVRPTAMVAVPRIFEKVQARIYQQVEQGSPLKQKLFHWAVDAGTKYYRQLADGKTPSPFLEAQVKLAYKLVLSKVYQRFGGRVKFFVSGGAPLNPDLAWFLRTANLLVLEGYGLTETCAPCAVNIPGQVRFGTVGKPFPTVDVKIADDGEILLKGPTVFKGYYNNPEDTAESIQDGWYHTGDLGEIDEKGCIKITGRKKDIIVTAAGKNVAPQKIENIAKSLPFISQFMVVGDKRKYLSALVNVDRDELANWAKKNDKDSDNVDSLLETDEVRDLVQKSIDRLNKDLASYETIKRFSIIPQEFSIETGELTPSMKVKRHFCQEKYQSEIDKLYGDG
jgi:long-chain acyl-CoA synthetase